MFNKPPVKKKEIEYCVLHKEDKGYYLSRVEIAKPLNLDPVQVGSKKDCLNYIKNNNNGNNSESISDIPVSNTPNFEAA